MDCDESEIYFVINNFICVLFSSGFIQRPTQPDVYSVVEQKLNSALPLKENTTFRSQAEWFNLQYKLLVSGYPERAYNLLSKLETESKNAKYYLDLTASRVAEEGAPETALTFYQKLG